MFASDMVITAHVEDDEQYIEEMIMGYRNFLEQSEYKSILIDSYLRDFGEAGEPQTLTGLSLDETVTHKIYYKNAIRYLGAH